MGKEMENLGRNLKGKWEIQERNEKRKRKLKLKILGRN